MQRFCLILLAMLSGTTLLGCQPSPSAPKALTPDQERQVQEQVQRAQSAEGAAQRAADK